MATTTKQAGRPAREKYSYRNEIQKLKKQVAHLEKEKLFLVMQLEGLTNRTMKYAFPTIKQRIKYLLQGEL